MTYRSITDSQYRWVRTGITHVRTTTTTSALRFARFVRDPNGAWVTRRVVYCLLCGGELERRKKNNNNGLRTDYMVFTSGEMTAIINGAHVINTRPAL